MAVYSQCFQSSPFPIGIISHISHSSDALSLYTELIMNAGGKDGRWLVRPRPSASSTGDYVLSLVFKVR